MSYIIADGRLSHSELPKTVNSQILELDNDLVSAVEWSTSASFKRILGSAQVSETKHPSYSISGLTAVSHTTPLKQPRRHLEAVERQQTYNPQT